MTKEADTEDNTSSTSLSDESSSNKGSNHPIGAAIGGAIHKISSPIGTGIRKVVRHDSSSKHRRDDSSSPALNKGKSLDENKQNPIKDVADFFGEGSKTVKRLVHHKRKDSSSRSVPDNDQDTDDLADLPPDDTLEKMNIIIDKRLKNVSISQYYETVWSEQSEGDGVPLFRSFLEESDKQDIDVGEWEVADNNAGFIGDWDGEEYQKRRVSYDCFYLMHLCLDNRVFYSQCFFLVSDGHVYIRQEDSDAIQACACSSKADSLLSYRRQKQVRCSNDNRYEWRSILGMLCCGGSLGCDTIWQK
jgi:hypothetical protein